MGNLTEVKTVFTIDLSPYLDGLKSMLTMTQQTGTQLKPLLNLQIGKADFTQLQQTFEEYQKKVAASIPTAQSAASAAEMLGNAQDEVEKKTRKTNTAQGEQEQSLKRSKRDALESYGAVMFLTQGLLRMASSSSGGSKDLDKLNRAMSEGVGQGFELAGLMGMLGIASGGTAVAIGAVATVAITLTRVFTDMNDTTQRSEKIQNDFARSLNGMTIPQLEEYRKKISESTLEIQKQIDIEKKRLDQQEGTVSGAMNLYNMFARLIGLNKVSKETEESLTRAKKEGQTVDEQIAGNRKTFAEIDQFMQQAKIDSIVRTNDRQRAEAKKTYDDERDMIMTSEAVGKERDDALAASRAKYITKISEINLQEKQEALANAKQITDAYLKMQEDRFEIGLNIQRGAMIASGAESESIELQLMQQRKERYKKQLSELTAVAGPLSPEMMQKQIDLEKNITQIEAQEADKRKAIKQSEKDAIARLSDLQLQEILNNVRLRGVEQGKTEEEISKDVLSRKKTAAESELKIINDGEAAGVPLDQKTKERKQQLENELTDIALQGADLRMQAMQNEKRAMLDGMNQIFSNMQSTFGSLFQLEQQRTTKTLTEEKKRKQATIDAEKEKALSSAKTADQRAAIEKDFADQKTALDAEMDSKAKSQMQTMFTLQKAAQIANAMINTYSAATAALAPPPLGLGPVFGPIVAATAIAAGLANIAVISAQEVPGLAEGTRVTRPTFALIGEAGPEIVAPERTFLDVFNHDLTPKILDVMVPKINESILAKVNLAGGSGNVYYQISIPIENFSGNDEDFTRLKTTIEDAMRRAGTTNASDLFKNQKST